MSEPRSASFYWSRGEEMPPDPEPSSGDVEAARAAIWTANGVNEMIDALDAFEAAIRAEGGGLDDHERVRISNESYAKGKRDALDEARAAVEGVVPGFDSHPGYGIGEKALAAIAAIDALRRDEG